MEAAKDRVIKVCQIGAGLIGKERISALISLIESGRNLELCGIYDPGLTSKQGILQRADLRFISSIDEILAARPDWIFIATPHDTAVELAKKALSRGVQVLLEKPMGRNLREAEALAQARIRENQLYIGFNYRFYAGIHAALKDIREKRFGNIISVGMALGHGGSPKDKTSWKLDPEKAGGGVLIDPGIHLIDLCRCMFPSAIQVQNVVAWRGFWNTGIEEEAHAMLQSGQSIINLQLSIVRWRSTFRIEINGDEGYGIIEGRGRSYGRQIYLRGKRWGWLSGGTQKETEEIAVETDGDDVFRKEIEALLFGSPQDLIRPCDSAQALEGMRLLEACRQSIRSPNP